MKHTPTQIPLLLSGSSASTPQRAARVVARRSANEHKKIAATLSSDGDEEGTQQFEIGSI